MRTFLAGALIAAALAAASGFALQAVELGSAETLSPRSVRL
jgi:hypothetical protein